MASSHKPNPSDIANEIRNTLKKGGSAKNAGVFSDFLRRSWGWRTADVRKIAVRKRREILKQHDLEFLLRVAEGLFHGCVHEEKNAAVFLLENMTDRFDDSHFSVLEGCLPRISN